MGEYVEGYDSVMAYSWGKRKPQINQFEVV